MTLCEALDWCRTNRAILYFSPSKITCNTQYGPYSGTSVVDVVEASKNEQDRRRRKEQENATR